MTLISHFTRYADAPSSGLPGNPASPDPGPGVDDLQVVNGTSTLVPFTPEPAPAATRVFPITVSFQNTDANNFLGFINTTVCVIFAKTLFRRTRLCGATLHHIISFANILGSVMPRVEIIHSFVFCRAGRLCPGNQRYWPCRKALKVLHL